MDILHSGWLTKSPPLKKSYGLRIFKSHFQKWRRRYFVLYAPPVCDRLTHTPALLDYYSNDKMTQKKGTIDLSQCRSVHAKLRLEAHSNIFMLRIEGEKSRDFYLSAETEEELVEWIMALQRVLGADIDAKTISQPLPETSDLTPMEKLSLSPVPGKLFKTNPYVNQPKKTTSSATPSSTTFYVQSQNNFQYTPRKNEMKLYHQQYVQQQSSWQQSNTQQSSTQQQDVEQQPNSPPESSELDDDSISENLEQPIPDSPESFTNCQQNIFDTTPTTSFQNNTPGLVYDLPATQSLSQLPTLVSKPLSSSSQQSSLPQASSSSSEPLTSSLSSSSLLSPPIPPKSIPDLNPTHYINSNIYDRPSNNTNNNKNNNNITNNNNSNNNLYINSINDIRSNMSEIDENIASKDGNQNQLMYIPISQTNLHHINSAIQTPITSSSYSPNNNISDNNNSIDVNNVNNNNNKVNKNSYFSNNSSINNNTSLIFQTTNSTLGSDNVYKLPKPTTNNNTTNNESDDNDDYLSISHVYKVPKSELMESGVDDVGFYVNSVDVMNRRCINSASKYMDCNAVNDVYNCKNDNNHNINTNKDENHNKTNFYINSNGNNIHPKTALKAVFPNDGYLDSHEYNKNPNMNHDFTRPNYNHSHNSNLYHNEGHPAYFPPPENEYIFLSEVQSFDALSNRLANIPLPTRINTGSSSSSSSSDDDDDDEDDNEEEKEEEKKTFSDFGRKDANHAHIHKSWSLNNDNKVDEKKGFDTVMPATSSNKTKSSNCILEPSEQVISGNRSGTKSSNDKLSGLNNSMGSCYDDDVFSSLERPEPPPKLHPIPQNLLPPKLYIPPLGNPGPDPHQACHTPIKYIDLDFVNDKPTQATQDQIIGKGLLGEELAQLKEMRGTEERSSSEGYHEIDIKKTQALGQIIAHREN